MGTREHFHKLIEDITDESQLKSYFELIQRLNQNETGVLWAALSEEEKEELMVSYEESHNPSYLISHEEVKKQHEKWLRK